MDFDGWTYDDFLQRLEAIRSFGSLEELAERIPGMDAILREMDVDIEGQLEPIERILKAMTPEERLQPGLLEGPEGPSRREAIAERAGVSLSAVESLIWQFQRLREMLSERSLDEVTQELMDEAKPEREAWQQAPEAWKAGDEAFASEDEVDEDETNEVFEEALEDFFEEVEGGRAEEAKLTGERLDELLRKIGQSGLDSLTPSERDELDRASEALRARS